MSREELARRQAELLAALVAGGRPPAGFDPGRLRATADALLRKRSGEVAGHWPLLAASYGPQWTEVFERWAEGRPPHGALRDGWDFARSAAESGTLSPSAKGELATRETNWRYDGVSPPVPRSAPGRLIHALIHRGRTG